MRWQIAITEKAGFPSGEAARVAHELAWLGLGQRARVTPSDLFLIEGRIDRDGAERLARELLADPVMQEARVLPHADWPARSPGVVTVLRRPGVMDPSEESLRRGAARIGIPVLAVRTARRWAFEGDLTEAELRRVGERALANVVVDEVLVGTDRLPAVEGPHPRRVESRRVALRGAGDSTLAALSREGGLALSVTEMRAIADHFAGVGRDPTETELETIAQTWSEHCRHKTMMGAIDFDGELIDNLFRETIRRATEVVDRDFCVSVFHDNAGVVRFDGRFHLCMKVETHNHPSAIEPYGGAATGLGGVIRDVLGTGLGGKPVANTDVFCVGPPDMPREDLPPGAIHPLRVLRGVVAGVRDYGNRMGIPTINGAVVFDRRYAGNPLVFCGTIGLIPVDRTAKAVRPGDRIVAVGGRTGRDGIHGATFSSIELSEHSESLSGGAVQIGNAITEKRMMDVVLRARDRGLYSAITDCGAGGFSSAVGEMGAETGARVDLARVPLKYDGLTPTEIWISEAQERMVLAVPPENTDALLDLCRAEDVEATVIGDFTDTGRLEIRHGDVEVADLSMEFLHGGLPRVVRRASAPRAPDPGPTPLPPADWDATLRALLALPDIASKEWIIRQYDHEVQAGSVVKPLVGARSDGPSDAAVSAPVLGSTRGFAVACGLNPRFGDLDPCAMARAAVDEAVRNVVAVGGDPDSTALLDNFCFGNPDRPEVLGALVLTSRGAADAAIALGLPFISGKDSLNNEYAAGGRTLAIPPTLLISALAIVPDVTKVVTMDLKAPGNAVYVVGLTRDELGGSQYAGSVGVTGGAVPAFDGPRALSTFRTMHGCLGSGLIRSCHDVADGGILVAAAEMAMAGGFGLVLDAGSIPAAGDLPDHVRLLSESLSRFLIEVEPAREAAVTGALDAAAIPFARAGRTLAAPRFEVRGSDGRLLLLRPLEPLRDVWRRALSDHLETILR